MARDQAQYGRARQPGIEIDRSGLPSASIRNLLIACLTLDQLRPTQVMKDQRREHERHHDQQD
jgi:hypothetical protein